MKFIQDEIYSMKLTTGEEVVTKVKDSTDTYVTITEPLSVAGGQQGMGLIPTLFTADIKGLIRLNINSIALMAPTEETIKAKYIEVTTGITMPSKKLVLG